MTTHSDAQAATVPFSRVRALIASVAFPVIVGVFCACEDPPGIQNPTVANLTATTVTLGGEVIADGDTRGIVYSRVVDDPMPTYGEDGAVDDLVFAEVDDLEGNGVFAIDITGLEPGTDYVFRVWSENKYGVGHSVATTFTTPAGVGGGKKLGVDGKEVRAIAVQADGKILVGGNFDSIAGEPCLNIARLHPDGSFDYSFTAEIDQPDYGAQVNAIAVQEDGKIVVGGYFDHINGERSTTTNVCIARLNPDGTRDTSFVATTNYGVVRSIAIDEDGTILVGGILVSVNGFTKFPHLVRLFDDGTIHPAFNPGPTNLGPDLFVDSIQIQEDGKIILAGPFNTYNNVACNRIIRIAANGTLDDTFDVGDASANSLALQPDDKVLFGGFVSPHGYGLYRVDGTGTLDPAFATSTGTGALTNDTIETIAVQADGKILIGGYFGTVDSTPLARIARINADGTLDSSFAATLDGIVVGVALGHDGKIVACSHFGVYTEDAKFLGFFNNDAATSTLTAVSSVDWMRGGGAPEVSHVTFEVSEDDGATWDDLGPVDRIVGGWQILSPGLPVGGLVRARGRTTGANYGGSSGLAEEIVEFGNASGTLLTVANPTSAAITNTEAELGGEVVSSGPLPILERGVVVSPTYLSSQPTVGSSAAFEYPDPGTTVGVFTVDVDDLRAATQYSFRAYATNANGTKYSSTATFQTSGPPTVLQPTVTAIDETTATLGGTVALTGGGTVSDRGVLYVASETRTTERLVAKDTSYVKVSVGAGGVGAFTTPVTGLTPGTDYRFVAYAESEHGTSYSPEGRFTTAAPSEPEGDEPTPDLYSVEESAGPGDVDSAYGPEIDGIVQSIAVLPDGGAILGGEFTEIDGVKRFGIAKVDDAGILDPAFIARSNGVVNSLALLPDGGCLVGGLFSEMNGASRNGIAKLDALGRTVDSADFDPGAGAAGIVYAIAVQPDGRILVGGLFEKFAGVTCGRIVRLDSDGSIDTTFNPGVGADDAVYSIAVQPDGQILVGGNFLNFGGTAVKRIVRLSATGVVDNSFVSAVDDGANDRVTTIVLPGEGRILIGGYFTEFDATNRGRVAGLSSSGALDTSYATGIGADGNVLTMAVQNDGKVLIGGVFSQYDTVACGRIARLDPVGGLDGTFNAGVGADGEVSAIALQEDGNLLVGGDFDNFNTTAQPFLTRFGNGAAVQTLTVVDGTRLSWTRSGPGPKAIPIGFEVSTDNGVSWSLLGTGTQAGGTLTLTGQDLPVQGTIRVNARTAGGFLGGSAGLVGDQVFFDHGPIIAGLQSQMAASKAKEAKFKKQIRKAKKAKKASLVKSLTKKLKAASANTKKFLADLQRYP